MGEITNSFGEDMILPDDFDPTADTYDITGSEPTIESLFTTEGVGESDGRPAEAQQAEPEPTTVPETPPAPAPQTIKVRFNHEDRELSFDEAALYAQKGMNYDKLEERVRGYEALNEKMTRLAKDLEYDSAEEMIDAAANNFKERQIRKLVEEGNTEAMARFLVDQQMKATSAPPPVQPEPPAQEVPSPAPAKPTLSPERRAELDEFIRAYPGVTKLPDEVLVANSQGVRLLVAYERYLNSQNNKELAILRQNQASAAKAPVTGLTGKAANAQPDLDDDPFMKGFNSY